MRNAEGISDRDCAHFVDIRNRDKVESVHSADRIDMVPRDTSAANHSDAKRLHRLPASGCRLPAAGIRSMELPCDSYLSPHSLHVPSPLSGSRIPHLHIQPIRRPGTPTTSPNAGTSFVTTLPAPMKEYSPRVVPQTTVAFAPIVEP